MTQKQIIEQALSEISLAEALVDQAKSRYYSARKKLESIYSPASPERAIKGSLSKVEQAKLLSRREKTILRTKPSKQRI